MSLSHPLGLKNLDTRNSEYTQSRIWCFAAGAASASILWSIAIWWRKRVRLREEEEGALKEYLKRYKNVRPKAFAQYIKSRIGELPTKPRIPMRWPWERIIKQPPASPMSPFAQLNQKMSDASLDDVVVNDPAQSKFHGKDLGVCIGSIFGLDVGGTLTKLVYFDISDSSSRLSKHSHKKLSSNNLQSNKMLRSVSSTNSLTEEGVEKHGIPKSFSMFDLSKSHHHAEALESFYGFVDRLDNFAGESGIKDKNLSFYSRSLEGEFHFLQFETRMMSSAMDLIKSNNLHANIAEMGATGGGAHKYADMWEENLGITMKKIDELESLVAGMQFVLEDGNAVGESYTFKPAVQQQNEINCNDNFDKQKPIDESINTGNSACDNDEFFDAKNPKVTKQKVPLAHEEETWSQKVKLDRPLNSSSYPYLVVIIGTGVSILRVDGPRKHERISGSTIGGGTYLGLCRLLTDMLDYEDVMNLAEKGDPSKVDMMVGDIYGQNSDALEKLGLPAWLVASSFGKLVSKQDPAAGILQEDLARALLIMVTNNIGQVAYLNAQLHNTSRLYFVGNFLRHNNISQRRLAYAIDYWSKGKMEALFLEHEGHFGALGAYLLSQGIPAHAETTENVSKANLIRQRSSNLVSDDRSNASDSLNSSLRIKSCRLNDDLLEKPISSLFSRRIKQNISK